jgi:putative toxin-antitoxin system antitoxin component (TIGR02293 family)
MIVVPSVSELLGIKAKDRLSLLSELANGLPLASLEKVSVTIAPEDQGFRFRLVPRATLARRQKAASRQKSAQPRLSAGESDRLVRLASIWIAASEVYKDPKAARRFLNAPHPLLGGRSAIDVTLQSEHGRPIVEDILGRLKYGTAV